MSADLAATVAALRDGDRVRATFDYKDGNQDIITRTVIVEAGMIKAGGFVLRYSTGTVERTLTAVEVLAPACPFDMGATVRRKNEPAVAMTVTGWRYSTLLKKWVVECDGNTRDGHVPGNLELVPPLPPEPPVGSGVFHDGRLCVRAVSGWFAFGGEFWNGVREWADLQPCVPAVPQEPDEKVDEAATLPTDEPDVPVGSVAVFRDGDVLFALERHRKGWTDMTWAYAVSEYGAPVAVISAGGSDD